MENLNRFQETKRKSSKEIDSSHVIAFYRCRSTERDQDPHFWICPKFGALIGTIPSGVFGGLSIVLFGLIAISGARIWVENRVDFSKSRNLLTAGISLIIGSGMVGGIVIKFGNITFDGIGVATFTAIVLHQILREKHPLPEESAVADSTVGREEG